MRRLRVLLLAALLAVSLGACGDYDYGDPSNWDVFIVVDDGQVRCYLFDPIGTKDTKFSCASIHE